MILIADSGSTKTTWCLCEKGTVCGEAETAGINPYFQAEEEINRCILMELMPAITAYAGKIRAVYFYGAGCIYDKTDIVRRAIRRHIPAAIIEVNTDLLAAARGVCGKGAGIACILGTGSNSCLYDGEKIVENISPLGFILGDEGGGVSLGRQLVSDLLKGMMPGGLKEEFLRQYNLTPAKIIDSVYRRPFPNRFLAAFSPFIHENLHVPAMRRLVYDGFVSFFERNVMKYTDYNKYKVSVSGSVGFYYKTILEEAAHDSGLRLNTIMKSPMEGLTTYHTTEL